MRISPSNGDSDCQQWRPFALPSNRDASYVQKSADSQVTRLDEVKTVLPTNFATAPIFRGVPAIQPGENFRSSTTGLASTSPEELKPSSDCDRRGGATSESTYLDHLVDMSSINSSFYNEVGAGTSPNTDPSPGLPIGCSPVSTRQSGKESQPFLPTSLPISFRDLASGIPGEVKSNFLAGEPLLMDEDDLSISIEDETNAHFNDTNSVNLDPTKNTAAKKTPSRTLRPISTSRNSSSLKKGSTINARSRKRKKTPSVSTISHRDENFLGRKPKFVKDPVFLNSAPSSNSISSRQKRATLELVGPDAPQMQTLWRMLAFLEGNPNPTFSTVASDVRKEIALCTKRHLDGEHRFRHLPGAIFERLVAQFGGDWFRVVFLESQTPNRTVRKKSVEPFDGAGALAKVGVQSNPCKRVTDHVPKSRGSLSINPTDRMVDTLVISEAEQGRTETSPLKTVKDGSVDRKEALGRGSRAGVQLIEAPSTMTKESSPKARTSTVMEESEHPSLAKYENPANATLPITGNTKASPNIVLEGLVENVLRGNVVLAPVGHNTQIPTAPELCVAYGYFLGQRGSLSPALLLSPLCKSRPRHEEQLLCQARTGSALVSDLSRPERYTFWKALWTLQSDEATAFANTV